jgi:hypothetical protein
MTYDDIENAFFFVSSGSPCENYAVIHRVTGESFCSSDFSDYDEMPEDVDENDDYLAVPHKNDLDLGKPLVISFVRQQCPEYLDRIFAIFSRQGAYRRYRDFLEEKDLLDAWYAYENNAIREALLKWAAENGLVVDG